MAATYAVTKVNSSIGKGCVYAVKIKKYENT